MPSDALLVLAPTTTAVANTNGTALDLTNTPGTPTYGLVARVRVATDSAAAAGATYAFSLQESPDNTNWTNLISSPAVAPATTANTSRAPINLPFTMSSPNGRYLRLVLTFSTTTGTPTVTYASELMLAPDGVA